MLTNLSIHLLLSCLTIPPTCAQVKDGPPPAKDIKVTVVVILASDQGNEIDKRLVDIAKEIRKRNENLTSFKLVVMTCESAKVGEKKTFKLVENQKAIITIKHGADHKDRVGLAITLPPLQNEIEYRTVCGKFLPIVTRYETQVRGERLIIAVRVQPCNGQ